MSDIHRSIQLSAVLRGVEGLQEAASSADVRLSGIEEQLEEILTFVENQPERLDAKLEAILDKIQSVSDTAVDTQGTVQTTLAEVQGISRTVAETRELVSTTLGGVRGISSAVAAAQELVIQLKTKTYGLLKEVQNAASETQDVIKAKVGEQLRLLQKYCDELLVARDRLGLRLDSLESSLGRSDLLHSVQLAALLNGIERLQETTSKPDEALLSVSVRLKEVLEIVIGLSTSKPEQLGERMDVLLRIVRDLSDVIFNTQSLVQDLERDANIMPWTFIVVDKHTRERLSKKEGYEFLKASTKNLTGRATSAFSKALWVKLSILFVCPVTRKIVKCGPKDNGYPLWVPRQRVNSGVFKFMCAIGDLIVKSALNSQGCPLTLPPLSELFAGLNMSEDTKEKILAAQKRAADAIGTHSDADAEADNFEAVFSAVNAEQQKDSFVFEAVATAEEYTGGFRDWIDGPKKCGLVKVPIAGGRSRWVSKELQGQIERAGAEAAAGASVGGGPG